MKIFLFVVFLLLLSSYNFVEATTSCSWVKRDVVFILDASGSISDSEFKLAQNFIIKMMIFLKKSNQDNRIAFIIFGNDARLVFNLDKHKDIKEMAKNVMISRSKHGMTAIGRALRLTMMNVVPIMRNDANRLVILFTDGTNNVLPSPFLYADQLKNANVQIMTVGIGTELSWKELTTIASPNMVLKVENMNALMAHRMKIINQLCVIVDPMPPKPCKIENQDLVIILDASGSIDDADYEIAKKFIVNLINKFEIGSDKTRIAMMSFSDSVRIDFDFHLSNKQKIITVVNSLKKFGSTTAIGLALKETLLKFKPKQRPGVPFNILLITDGVNNVFPKPKESADLLKKEGANIVTIGVGNNINIKELQEISSDGKILTADSFKELQTSLKTVLKTVTCG